ncbi:nitroreductase [Lentzea sp. E54]|uniref:nitroreductase n=1 Tax=Lentzea xerophila TaxID=3435883 RepID=UPI003DA61B8B
MSQAAEARDRTPDLDWLRTLMTSRRSIRGYRPDPVPRGVIAEILDVACASPSSMNTQPWHFYVITGEPLDEIRRGNSERMLAGEPVVRDIDVEEEYTGVHRERQVEVAVQLFTSMGIERHDRERRLDWTMRGFRQFDAPVSIAITYDRALDRIAPIAHFDLGAVTYGLVLAAWAKGLGTVINGQGAMQAHVVRKHAGIADEHRLITCVALGYPDDEFPANAVKSHRVPRSVNTTFVGFPPQETSVPERHLST